MDSGTAPLAGVRQEASAALQVRIDEARALEELAGPVLESGRAAVRQLARRSAAPGG